MDVLECRYKDQFSTECLSAETGVSLVTDAPREHGGRGVLFSPTDLLALSLGSCILTLMGMKASRLGFDLGDCRCLIKKHMSTTLPRMISCIELEIICLSAFSQEIQQQLELAAKTCPVHNSLHPNIKQIWTFHFGVRL